MPWAAFLPYVAAGVAFGQFDFEELNRRGFLRRCRRGFDRLDPWDWAANTPVTDNWIVRGEYRYTDFDDQDFVEQPVDDDWSAKLGATIFALGVALQVLTFLPNQRVARPARRAFCFTATAWILFRRRPQRRGDGLFYLAGGGTNS